MKGIMFQFASQIWKHMGPGNWYFIYLPVKLSKEVRVNLQSEEEGWGRLKVTAKIGNTEWKTAI